VSARAVAWVALLSVIAVVVFGAYFAISSSLAFFNEEASKVAGQLSDAPQLRSVVEQTVRFCSSFIWMVFVLLALTLGVCLVVLWLESLATR
jgi:hypothetical protein